MPEQDFINVAFNKKEIDDNIGDYLVKQGQTKESLNLETAHKLRSSQNPLPKTQNGALKN